MGRGKRKLADRNGGGGTWDKKPRGEGDSKGAAGGAWQRSSSSGYDAHTYRNPSFEVYYQLQGVLTPEEWSTFMLKLREPLPAVFRIHMDCPYRDK
jgi:hypothetical protein